MVTEIGTVGTVLEILTTIAEPTAPEPDPLRILALLVGVPLLAILIVAAAVLGPQWSRAGRWRPGQPWVNDPVWLGSGDAESASAVLTAESTPALAASGAAELASTEGAVEPQFTPGGARGQW